MGERIMCFVNRAKIDNLIVSTFPNTFLCQIQFKSLRKKVQFFFEVLPNIFDQF